MPQPIQANKEKYLFSCTGDSSTRFEVIEFTGTDTISQPYEFEILLTTSNRNVDIQKIINTPATLFLFRNGELYPYSGIVADFNFLGYNADFATYSARLVPKLKLLDLNHQTRIFQKKKVSDIIKDVFTDASIPGSYYELNLTDKANPEREFILQYQESDLNFIQRLMEEYGIFYFFVEKPISYDDYSSVTTQEKMIISDKAEDFNKNGEPIKISYHSVSQLLNIQGAKEGVESVHSLRVGNHIMQKEYKIKSYNHLTPETRIISQKSVTDGHSGVQYDFGGTFKNAAEAENIAAMESKRIQCTKINIDGAGNCSGFRAGRRITVNGHERTDCTGDFLLTGIVHQSKSERSGEGAHLYHYSNEFGAIPAEQSGFYHPPKRAAIPTVPGLITASIEADGSSYAMLDEKGRYKVRFAFDESETKNSQASKFIRLAQPYSGAQYGIHFPSHENTEMILGCVNGDPNKPLGLGTVPNANTLSPVTSKNKEKSIIKTAGGNSIELDDTDGKQKIQIRTNGKHTVEFDDGAGRITMHSAQDNKIIIDDTNKKLSIEAQKHTIVLSYGDEGNCITMQTEEGHSAVLDDENKAISLQSSGGHALVLNDDDNTITVTDGGGQNTFTLDGGGGTIIESQGEIQISAQGDVSIKGANVSIESDNALDATAAADLTLNGSNIMANGEMNVTVEAGMNAEVTGQMATKVEGGMTADLKGGTKAAVSGGVVMIN